MDIKHHHTCPLLELKARGSCSSSILNPTPLTEGYLKVCSPIIIFGSNFQHSCFPKFTNFMICAPLMIPCLASIHKLNQVLNTWKIPSCSVCSSNSFISSNFYVIHMFQTFLHAQLPLHISDGKRNLLAYKFKMFIFIYRKICFPK